LGLDIGFVVDSGFEVVIGSTVTVSKLRESNRSIFDNIGQTAIQIIKIHTNFNKLNQI
jgi:hypothetical protein